MDGILLVNKPRGKTSHDLVALARRRSQQRRIGHTGTLDPNAEGLLVLLVGRATKQQQDLQGHDKVYEATLTLGSRTETGDSEGRVVERAAIPRLDIARIESLFTSLKGSLTQTPPAYSAVKVNGKPSYWWARRGQTVALKSRTITIHEMQLLEVGDGMVHFRLHCSSGTYVRTLSEQIAEQLGTVGYLSALRRLKVGPWNLHEAVDHDWLASALPNAIEERLLRAPSEKCAY